MIKSLIVFITLLLIPSVSNASAPTITYAVATESSVGMDGAISWQSVFLQTERNAMLRQNIFSSIVL